MAMDMAQPRTYRTTIMDMERPRTYRATTMDTEQLRTSTVAATADTELPRTKNPATVIMDTDETRMWHPGMAREMDPDRT